MECKSAGKFGLSNALSTVFYKSYPRVLVGPTAQSGSDERPLRNIKPSVVTACD